MILLETDEDLNSARDWWLLTQWEEQLDSVRTAESEILIFQSCLWDPIHFSRGLTFQRLTLTLGAQADFCGVPLWYYSPVLFYYSFSGEIEI